MVGLGLMALLLGLTLVPGAPEAQQRKPVTVTSLRCPLGCGVTEGDTILGSFFAKEHPWLVYQS
ncbi:MAG: hypothetical protein ACREJV_14690, partial [Candidatus Rokuibacteriota bacterium]